MSTTTSDDKAESPDAGGTHPAGVNAGTPPAVPPMSATPKSPLATASMIVGIAAIICAIVPGLSFIAFIPAITATVLGIIALVARKPCRGRALTGAILGPIALVVAIIVSVSTIAAGINGAAGSDATDDKVVSEPADEPAEEAAVEEPAEVEEPAPVAVPADLVYQGTGDSILPIELVDGAGQVAVASITHTGARNFAIWSLDDAMTQQDLLVNTIGNYSGTVLFNHELSGVDTSSLEITADGAWTVTVRSLLSVREFDGASVTGAGDDVVVYRGDAGAATISHDGARNFAIWSYGNSSDLVVNEIGVYSGTTRWTAGPSVIVVSADGNWGISVA